MSRTTHPKTRKSAECRRKVTMSMPELEPTSLQYGVQVSLAAGLVPATAKWRGEAQDIETRVWKESCPENIGLAGVTFRRYIAALGGRSR
jgi:hypothetical protein